MMGHGGSGQWICCKQIMWAQDYFVRGKYSGFPLRLENLEKREGILQSGNFEKIRKVSEESGKMTENTGKHREFLKEIYLFI